jgi:diaminopimelate epimerase
MTGIPFTKMSGLGNDFIIVDNRTGVLKGMDIGDLARRICAHRLSLGGDQLMILEPPAAGGDLSMRTINVDGAEVLMCGNASRCVARYAFVHGIAGAKLTIETPGGPVHASVEGSEVQVALQLTGAIEMDRRIATDDAEHLVHVVHVSGVPHAVVFRDRVAAEANDRIRHLGAAIRRHPQFPEGINVDFIEVMDRHAMDQRSYERGVEGETLACGTGAVASTVISAARGLVDSPVRVHVLGGELAVTFEREAGVFVNLVLGGEARFIADGVLHPEAWSWADAGLRPGASATSWSDPKK